MNRFGAVQAGLQDLGRALMLPIAVLPVAALMLRLGQPDLLDQPFMAAAGNAIFAQIGLLFAIGVGVGLAKGNHGAAGLAGAVAYLVVTEGAKIFLLPPDNLEFAAAAAVGFDEVVINAWRDNQISKLSVPAGIIAGLAAGILYNRYHTISLPEYLSFFGGRRFVPIAAGGFGLIAALALGYGFAMLVNGIDMLSEQVAAAGPAGLFAYGMLNRLLLVTGLHHILNNLAWFVVGSFDGMSGDLNRFFAGDPAAGGFMTGFFPIMMFGLPGACLAMWQSVPAERRKAMAGIYISMALTSFLTGVTEPVEFTFMFIAPLLYIFHAAMTGLSMAIMDMLGVRLGFGFSAGLFDYILNYPLGTNARLLLPVGTIYFIAYYAVFLIVFRKLNIAAPGVDTNGGNNTQSAFVGRLGLASAYVDALGGKANLVSIDACTTRLRLTLHDTECSNADQLRSLGAKGVIRLGEKALQVIIGPDADRLAEEMRGLVAVREGKPTIAAPPSSRHGPTTICDQQCLMAAGGNANVASFVQSGSRVIIEVIDRNAVQFDFLERHFGGRWLETPSGAFHLIKE